MKGRISNKMGEIQINPDVIALYAGTIAVECFGIVGMAAVSMKDGLVKLLKRESLTHGINVDIKENKISNIIIKTLPQNITKQNLKILRKYKVKTIKMEVASLSNYLLKRAQFSFSYESVMSIFLLLFFSFDFITSVFTGFTWISISISSSFIHSS